MFYDSFITQFKDENPDYLTQQLITYIGNKRMLLPLIAEGLNIVCAELKTQHISILDIFSGSGIVSRFLKPYAHTLFVNDIQPYARVISQCYLANKSETNWELLLDYHEKISKKLDRFPFKSGFISELYAPQDDGQIQAGERVFYTRRNAKFLDTARQYIAEIPVAMQPFLLGPLLSQASVHANTGGVFKGFYKNKHGMGQFGGTGKNALSRILSDIHLTLPVLSNFNSQVHIYQEDANTLANKLPDIDIAYLDPPYNQHPYGSNYFMLNLLLEYRRPNKISKVSGIPQDWQRSPYNRRKMAKQTLQHLCANIPAKYLLVSFNSEGFIGRDEMEAMLQHIGSVTILSTQHPTFRASRNLGARGKHVQEYLYIIKKK